MKKRIAAFLLASILVFSFAACKAENTDKQDGAKLKKITFCLDWTPNTNHTGLYVAQAKGWFKEAGLEVELVQPPENGATSMCAAGKAQFAVTAQDTLAPALAREEPLGVTAVAALLQHNTSGIISRKGEGMDAPKGLEGKRYSTWDNPVEQATIQSVMKAQGGDFSKVTLQPNNITDEAGALKTNQTDAIWVFYGWGGISAQQQNVPTDFFYFKDLNPVFDYYTPVIVANNTFLKEHAEQARAFLSAARKGYEFAAEHPEEAADLLIAGDTTGSLKDSRDLVVASQKWISKQYKAEADRWGFIDPTRWDGFYQWLTENKLVEKALPAGTGYSNDYLEK